MEKLNCKSLMIGDWVRTEAGALIVAGVGHKIYCRANDGNPTHLWEVTSIEPIPLTQEILEKNGFSFTGSGQRDMMLATPFGIAGDRYNIYVGLKKKTIEAFVAFANTESKAGWRKHNSALLEVSGPYVHELQRVLRCTGLFELANNFKI